MGAYEVLVDGLDPAEGVAYDPETGLVRAGGEDGQLHRVDFETRRRLAAHPCHRADQRPLGRRRAVNQFVPRYYEIEQTLRARVATLDPDSPLPSDAQLCEEFGVSRMTARNAVQRLVQDGLVYRLPGKGTYVAATGAHREASNLTSFTKEMRRRGRAPSSRFLERELRKASELEERRLQLPEGSSVVSIRRIRLADGEPVAIEHAVLRADAADAALDADLEKGSLHEALSAGGFVLTRGHGTIGSEPAEPDEAALLDVPSGWPLLVERRVIVDERGKPLELTESRYASGRYALDVDFVVERGEQT
jgi:GntR family transcriptional regulator